MEWSTMRDILMSRFIRTKKHAGLWCQKMFFPLLFYLSMSPYYNLIQCHFPCIMSSCFFSCHLVSNCTVVAPILHGGVSMFQFLNCFCKTKNDISIVWYHETLHCSIDMDNILKAFDKEVIVLLYEMFLYFAQDTNLSCVLGDVKSTLKHGNLLKVFSCRNGLMPLFYF